MRLRHETPAPPSSPDLVQYAEGIARMQQAIRRIHANKKAISESLLRSAAALRSMSRMVDSASSLR